MATHIGIGFSQNTDTAEAGLEAAILAKTQLKHSEINLAIVFSTIHYNPADFLPNIHSVLNQPKIIGCSSAGIILSKKIAMRGLAVVAIYSDDIHFGVSHVRCEESQDILTTGVTLAKEAITDLGNHRRHAFIFFTDGLLKNNSLILRGTQEILGSGFPILGAGSCDDFHFKKTFQYYQDRFFTNATTGLLMGGQMSISLGSKHGWRPLGKPRIIDKADGHIIRTIDGKKASSIYEEYFGDETKNLRSSHLNQLTILYPLGIYLEEENEYLLRHAVNILDDGSIVCQDTIPEGVEVHIMIGNKDSCKQAAMDAAKEVQNNLFGKQPKLVIIFESLARHKLLGRDSLEEIRLIDDILGKTAPIVGMYSYGEISPFQSLYNIKKNHLQNQSIVILAIA